MMSDELGGRDGIGEERRAGNEMLERFRRKIAVNAAGWLAFVQTPDLDPVDVEGELANIGKAAQQALAEPTAYEPGLALVQASWRYVEQRGHWLAWQDLLLEALQLSQQHGHRAHEAALLDQLGELGRILGDNDLARARQQASLALYQQSGDKVGMARVLAHLSQIYMTLNDYQAADDCCCRAVGLLGGGSREEEVELAVAYNNWGIVCMEMGKLEDALAHLQQAAAKFERQRSLVGQAKIINNQGEVLRRLRRWDEAAQYFAQSVAMARAGGDEASVLRGQLGLSIVLHEQGQTAEALAISQNIEAVYRRRNDRTHLARVVNNEGVFLAALGRFDEALRAYASAIDLHLAAGNLLYAARTRINCAEVLIDLDRLTEAELCLRQVREVFEAGPHPPGWIVREYEVEAARLEARKQAQPG